MDTSDLYIDYLCRTCMIKLKAFRCEGSTEPQHQSIFETIEECDELRIADLLSRTIPQIVEVQLSDELPKKICCKCLHQLIILYRFQKLCVQSDHKMREMVSKKWDDLNMSMMETAIEDEVLPNDADSYPLSSCQPKCTPQNSLLPETETALEGRQEAIESESAQNDEHSLKNEQLLDFCENSQGELNEFMKNDPIEDEENTEISEFIKNEPVEDDEENTEYSDTVHSTTFVAKEEFTTEEQKVIVPYKNIRDKNYQYACDVCGKHLKTKWNLKIHKRIHSDEKPHKCDFCEKRFIQGQNVRHHMRTHTGEKPCKCKYCDRCFTTKKVLNKHLRVHLGDTIHRCKFCPLAFRYASELRLHSITHKDEDPETRERNMAALREEEAKLKVNRYKNIRDKNEQYPCDICGKNFKTKSILNRHKLYHSGEKAHKCDFCEKEFIQASDLNQHMRTHTGEKPYKCKYCKRCFATKSILNKHFRVHVGDNIHRCDSCPLAFRLASELRFHSTTHKDEDLETHERYMAALREEEAKFKGNRDKTIRGKKEEYQYHPYDVCGKHLKTTRDIKKHDRIHSGEKPHKCDFCEKRFNRASALRHHMRTHTGEKPYKCKYCDQCFTTKKILNKHLRVHLGVNIYKCEFCPLAVRLASELRLHSFTHTHEDPETRERNMAALREEEAKLKVNRYKNIRDKNYQYPCDICGKHFKKTWQLNRHKLFHSDEKPHKCDFCEKQFIQAADLNQHMRTHTGEKPYKCKYCYRCFTTTNALNDHLGVHLGNNIHRCKFCPLAFRLASELRLHSTTHRDEDPETRERNMAALREEEAKLKVYR
ncbi:zinc finger protein 271-like isoform X1 [Eurosta solidaginis]|uniref:zinc finger protein 271-like isoform X1 n=1 Tax=Eurosta solidaginis TaxID=178769 RepID=UPI0035315400